MYLCITSFMLHALFQPQYSLYLIIQVGNCMWKVENAISFWSPMQLFYIADYFLTTDTKEVDMDQKKIFLLVFWYYKIHL